MLVDLARLERDYYERKPDVADPNQLVSFGTSGHRGSSLNGTFTEAHILAITQAICDYRSSHDTDGPLQMGKDTHALSTPAQRTALEVLAANDVETVIQQNDGVTPTPVISRAIIVHNRGRKTGLADGIVITPSHNPPEDGGFKYNPTNGGPADTDVTKWVQDRANELLRENNSGVKRVPFAAALKAATTHEIDFILPYVEDLKNVVDMDAIRAAGLKLGVDPLGGAALPYWEPINSIYKLDIKVVNPKLDPQFAFMTVDHDGKIRMDCSSPYRDGQPRRTEGQIPRRVRQRSGFRPARHRHAVGGLDESESLSRGGHRLSAHASSAVEGGRGDRQNAREQQHD